MHFYGRHSLIYVGKPFVIQLYCAVYTRKASFAVLHKYDGRFDAYPRGLLHKNVFLPAARSEAILRQGQGKVAKS